MAGPPLQTESQSPCVETHLLGSLPLERAVALQQRLVGQLAARDDGQITLLLCEHPAIITIGRAGSPAQVANQSQMVRSRQIEVRWVNRGGGCLVHCPGQLAIYPLVPLRWHGFSLGDYLERLQAALLETLDEMKIPARTPPGRFGAWGRTGQLAAVGVAVRDWVSYYGAYLNVSPSRGLLRLVESDSQQHTPMGSMVAERCGPAKMTAIRAALVERLTAAFGCDRYHLYTGHPLLGGSSRRRSNDA